MGQIERQPAPEVALVGGHTLAEISADALIDGMELSLWFSPPGCHRYLDGCWVRLAGADVFFERRPDVFNRFHLVAARVLTASDPQPRVPDVWFPQWRKPAPLVVTAEVQDGAAPKGWKLVPMEATVEMLQALADRVEPGAWDAQSDKEKRETEEHFRAWWRALLSASGQPFQIPSRVPTDPVLRSRVADLLHLLENATISTPTAGDEPQARAVMSILRAMLAPALDDAKAPAGEA